jgi:hypothetical protein
MRRRGLRERGSGVCEIITNAEPSGHQAGIRQSGRYHGMAWHGIESGTVMYKSNTYRSLTHTSKQRCA